MLGWPALLVTLPPDQCAHVSTDINYGQGFYYTFRAANATACCSACAAAQGYCQAWDWATDSHGCWLKDNADGDAPRSKRMSGTVRPASRNESAAYWQDKRDAVLRTIWDGGALPLNRSRPDAVEPTNVSGLTKLRWRTSSRLLDLDSYSFHHVKSTESLSHTAVVMAHGHFYANWNYTSNCFRATATCPWTPTCNLSCAFWDLNNVSTWLHADLGVDYFTIYMPLMWPNALPNGTAGVEHDAAGNHTGHEWFRPFAAQGDKLINHFIEPVVLCTNYALSLGYEDVVVMGLSGGGPTAYYVLLTTHYLLLTTYYSLLTTCYFNHGPLRRRVGRHAGRRPRHAHPLLG